MSDGDSKVQPSIDAIGGTAMTLIERWGASPSVPDGETSSGAQRGRVLTPQETAERALETARAIHYLLRNSGHIWDE